MGWKCVVLYCSNTSSSVLRARNVMPIGGERFYRITNLNLNGFISFLEKIKIKRTTNYLER